MPKRSLFNQFTQLRGTRDFQYLNAYNEYAEDTGRSYLNGTLTTSAGSSTVTDSSNAFEKSEQGNFIIMTEGPDAGTVFTIVSGTGTFNAEIDSAATGTGDYAYRRHYFQNLEDDLNYLRTLVRLTTGEDDWYADPQTTLKDVDTNLGALDAKIDTASGTLQTQITSNDGDIAQNASDISDLDTKIDTTSGTLQTEIDNNYTTLDNKIDTTSGTLQDAIDALGESQNEFIELIDTPSSYTESRVLFESADAVVDDAAFTFVSGTQTLNVPNITTTADVNVGGNVDVTGTMSFDSGQAIDEFVTTIDASSTDSQVGTAASVYTLVSTTSGTLQTQITDNYNTLDTKIDTTSGTLQQAINDLGEAQNEFLELEDVFIDSYTANNMMYTTASGVEDTDAFTFTPGGGQGGSDLVLIQPNGQQALKAEANTGNNDLYMTLGSMTGQSVGIYMLNDSAVDMKEMTLRVSDQNFMHAEFDTEDAGGYVKSGFYLGTGNESSLMVSYGDEFGDEIALSLEGKKFFMTDTSGVTTYTTTVGRADNQISIAEDGTPTTTITVGGTTALTLTGAGVTLASGTSVNEILDSTGDITAASTDDQLATAKLIYNEMDGLNAGLTDDIVWEVVDTPFEQIRPKTAHQGKPIYTYGSMTIGGDLTVSGTTTTIHSEELTVADKIITVNYGEVGNGLTGERYAGMQVDRGQEEDYYFVFDEVENNFQIGISGSLQPVATREFAPEDTRVPWWSGAEYMFRTQGDTYQTIVTTSGSGNIAMVTDGVETLDLKDDIQLLGVIGDSRVSVSQLGAGNVMMSAGSTTVMYATPDQQQFGDTNMASSFMSIDQTSDQFTFKTGPSTTALTVAEAGITLETGTTVNEILDSTDTLDASSTDDQLATAKLIYEEMSTLSGTVGALTFTDLTDTPAGYSDGYFVRSSADAIVYDQYVDHNADTDNKQGGTTDEYYHLTNNEYSGFSSDGTTFSFSQEVALPTGGAVDEVVTTVVSGSTDKQLPTAKAVWDLTEAAAAAVHTHVEVDGVYVSNTSWTYGTGFSEVPADLRIFVNGVKQRIGATYDCTVAVPGGVFTITFNYNVYSTDWVSIEYTE